MNIETSKCIYYGLGDRECTYRIKVLTFGYEVCDGMLGEHVTKFFRKWIILKAACINLHQQISDTRS